MYGRYRGVRDIAYYLDWNNVPFGPGTAIDGQSDSRFLGLASLLVIVGLVLGALGIVLITHYLWHNPYNRLER